VLYAAIIPCNIWLYIALLLVDHAGEGVYDSRAFARALVIAREVFTKRTLSSITRACLLHNQYLSHTTKQVQHSPLPEKSNVAISVAKLNGWCKLPIGACGRVQKF